MQKVRMLETLKGSPDGVQIKDYKAGNEYELPDELVNNFLSVSGCELVHPKVDGVEQKPGKKADEPAVENKADEPAKENKAKPKAKKKAKS